MVLNEDCATFVIPEQLHVKNINKIQIQMSVPNTIVIQQLINRIKTEYQNNTML